MNYDKINKLEIEQTLLDKQISRHTLAKQNQVYLSNDIFGVQIDKKTAM